MAMSIDNKVKSVTSFQEKLELDATSKNWGIPIEWILANCERGTHEGRRGWWFLKNSAYPQFRPDSPTDPKRKYLGMPGVAPQISVPIIPSDLTAHSFLAKYAHIVIGTEGMKKAIFPVMHGIRAFSNPGVWNAVDPNSRPKRGGTKKELVASLRGYMTSCNATTIVIDYDADAATNDDVMAATIEFADVAVASGYHVYVMTGMRTMEQGKGTDDYIRKNGIEAYLELLERCLQGEEHKPTVAPRRDRESLKVKGKIIEPIEIIKAHYGTKLRFNELKSVVELECRRWDAENIRVDLAYATGLELSNTDALQFIAMVARSNSYHPVVEYLNHVSSAPHNSTGTEDIKQAFARHWEEILGINEPLPVSQLTKTLVGAVARAFIPGCSMRTVTVLYGGQNIGKSTFWRELMGEQFYSDAYEGTSEKDDLLKLHKAFIHEIPEIDVIYRKTDASKLKRNISQRQDEIRAPYAAETVTRDRRCIITGTTNSQDILRDVTGNTRFWIISLHQRVDIQILINVRDELWALAVALYKTGETWELNDDEQALNEQINAVFTTGDLIDGAVEEFCHSSAWDTGWKPWVIFDDVIAHCFPDESKTKVSPQDQRRTRDALRTLKYESTTKKVDGRTVRVWERKVVTVTAVTVKNDYCYPTVTTAVQGFEQVVTVVTPPNQTFENNGIPTTLPPVIDVAESEDVIFGKVESSTVTTVTNAGMLTTQESHRGNGNQQSVVTSVTRDRALEVLASTHTFTVTDDWARDGEIRVGFTIELIEPIEGLGDRGTRFEVSGLYANGALVEVKHKNAKTQKLETIKKQVPNTFCKVINS